MVPVTASAGAAAAIQKRKEQQEEEEMTQYSTKDLDGWEFKIIRSMLGAFKKREIVTRVCDEESKAGWEMVEKFDDNRIRFKRRVDQRARDASRAVDPYRTTYGIGEGTLVAIIIGGIAFLIATVIVLMNVFGK